MRQRFAKWVNRRIPPAREVTLDQRRIFIFPSRVSVCFFGICLFIMLLTAINFQNNLSYGLTFLLANAVCHRDTAHLCQSFRPNAARAARAGCVSGGSSLNLQ